MKKQIKYKGGYKYLLTEDFVYYTGISRAEDVNTQFIDLGKAGRLLIKSGYAWDGPSGPTIDTKNFMKGSLVHDALYQLMREEEISRDWRKKSDQILWEICIKDGMSKIRAQFVYWGVRIGSGPSSVNDGRPERTAP